MIGYVNKLVGHSFAGSGALLGYSITSDEETNKQKTKRVIKVFPIDCPYRYINGIQRKNKNGRDYGNHEIGTALMMSDMFLSTGVTCHIAQSFSYQEYKNCYEVDRSMSTKQQLPKQDSYVIRNDPSSFLFPLYESYTTSHVQGNVETPSLSDDIRVLVSEKCDGDMEYLVTYKLRHSVLVEVMDSMLYEMCAMIFHTLLLFDSVLGGYSHYDLGLRNIFYMDPMLTSSMKDRCYVFPDGSSLDIKGNQYIPKIGDFAWALYGKASDFSSYYDYLSPQTLPLLSHDLNGSEERYNDPYVLLNDIHEKLSFYGYTSSSFYNLDLGSVRDCKTNTSAVEEFFRQRPIRHYVPSTINNEWNNENKYNDALRLISECRCNGVLDLGGYEINKETWKDIQWIIEQNMIHPSIESIYLHDTNITIEDVSPDVLHLVS